MQGLTKESELQNTVATTDYSSVPPEITVQESIISLNLIKKNFVNFVEKYQELKVRP